MSDTPILFEAVEDGALIPANSYWQRKAAERFKPGQKYELVEVQERSSASHRAYFAQIREAWMSLPEILANQYPTPEHLRKAALIRAGYFNSVQLPCATRKAALDAANFVRSSDDLAIVTVTGTIVTRFTAKSQSYRSMPKGEFQESKNKVIGVISEMIGTTPAELSKAQAA